MRLIDYFLIISSLLTTYKAYLLIGRQTSKLDPLFHYEISLITNERINYHKGISQSAWILPNEINKTIFTPSQVLHSMLYVSEVLVYGRSPAELITGAQEPTNLGSSKTWRMNYHVINPYLRENKLKMSSKMLMCALSQKMKGSPVLYPDEEADGTYDIAELSDGFYMGRRLTESTDYNVMEELWSRRPFAFSSASSLDMTESIMNIFMSLLKPICPRPNGMLLDPFCGSATMAISALRCAHMDTSFSDVILIPSYLGDVFH